MLKQVIICSILFALVASHVWSRNAGEQKRTTGAPLRILLVKGLFGYLYTVEQVTQGLEVIHLYYNQHHLKIENFPRSWEELQHIDVIVFVNTSVRILDTEQLQLLRDAIREGKGFLILGGKVAYGASGIRGSVLDEVLPLEIADTPFDIERVEGILAPGENPIIADVTLPTHLVSPFIHRVQVRTGGDVTIRAGEKPFLVSGEFGGGRVACFVGTPYGTAPEWKTMFYRWQNWPELLSKVLYWLAHREHKL